MGYKYKLIISDFIKSLGHTIIDVGAYNDRSSDFPDYGEKGARAVSSGEADFGILICGTGIGMSITANKFKGIRAAVCWNEETARLAREHNNANILCLGARFLKIEECINMIKIFINTLPSNEERHIRRINKIIQIEEGGELCGK
jgi:ribose 5-phosphate isomerase B